MEKKSYPYKVSVSIITYNQAEYIKKAVDGALAQEVDFPYEIIIGDDCSTDGTRDILRDYKQRYPDLIKLNLHDKHYDGIPGRLNNITNIRSARGKYIAFCDGDDYWISNDKLQKQADFMDAHPKFSFSFHDGICMNEISKKKYTISERNFLLKKTGNFSYKNIVRREINILASSGFYRKKNFDNLPPWFWKVHLADRVMQLLAAQNGPIRYQKDIKMLRVINEKSVSNVLSNNLSLKKIKEKDLQIIENNFPDEFERPLSSKASFCIHRLIKYKNKKNYYMMMVCLWAGIWEDPKVLYFLKNKVLSKISLLFNNFK